MLFIVTASLSFVVIRFAVIRLLATAWHFTNPTRLIFSLFLQTYTIIKGLRQDESASFGSHSAWLSLAFGVIQ